MSCSSTLRSLVLSLFSTFLGLLISLPALGQEEISDTYTADYLFANYDEAGNVLSIGIPGVGHIELEFLAPDFLAWLESGALTDGPTSSYAGMSAFGPPQIPNDPTTPPGPDWEWRGPEPIGTPPGAWHNPGTGESLQPDLDHPLPKGPHWGYTDPYGNVWDYFPDTGEWKPHPANRPNRPQPTLPLPPEDLPMVELPEPRMTVPPIVPIIPTTPTPTPPVRPIWPGILNPFRIIPIFMFDIRFMDGYDPNMA